MGSKRYLNYRQEVKIVPSDTPSPGTHRSPSVPPLDVPRVKALFDPFVRGPLTPRTYTKGTTDGTRSETRGDSQHPPTQIRVTKVKRPLRSKCVRVFEVSEGE